jgi:hypothetical protein
MFSKRIVVASSEATYVWNRPIVRLCITGCVDVNMHGVMQHRCVLYQSAVAGSVRAGLPGFDSRKRQWDFSRSWECAGSYPTDVSAQE